MSRVFSCVLLVVSGSCLPHGTTAEPKALTPEDILNTRWATQVALSPDGTRVACVVIEPEEADAPGTHRLSRLYVAPVDASQPPVIVASAHVDVSGPIWSPDNEHLAFRSKGTGEQQQVWVHHFETQQTRCLTSLKHGAGSFQWSPDGTEIAIITPRQAAPHSDPLDSERPRVQHKLVIVTYTEGRSTDVTTDEQHVVDFTWSPDATAFAIVTATSADPDVIFESSSLSVINRAGDTHRVLSRNVADRRGLAWSADGKYVAFLEFAPKHFAWRLAVVTVATGSISHPLHNFPGTPESGFGSLTWSADSESLRLRVFEGTRCRIVCVNITTHEAERKAVSLRNYWSHSISRDGRVLALAAEASQSPQDIYIVTDDADPVRITNLNPQFSDFHLGQTRSVTWKNTEDGRTVHGVVITPPDFEPGRPAPAVVQLHGGPQGMWWDGWHGTELSWGQLLASNGFVVFLPNPRGSIGQGWQFSEAVYNDWGGLDLQDVLDGLDVLISEGIVDEHRVGLGGWSYGGFLTAAATTKTSRFKTAIVGAGITDLYTYALTVDEVGWVRRFLGGDELTWRSRYTQLSPLTSIHHCTTPTLVLHGEQDQRCPLSQGRAWHRGLKALGVESQLVVYPREGHLFSERAHKVDLLDRVLSWYRQHLLE